MIFKMYLIFFLLVFASIFIFAQLPYLSVYLSMSDSSNYTIIHYSPICDGCISVGSNEFYNSNQYKLEDDYFQFVIIDKNDDRMTVNFKTNPGYFITYIYIRDVPFIPGIIDITEYLEYYPNDDDIMFIKIANSLWGEDCGCD